MILKDPFCISARLMPAVRVGGNGKVSYISIEPDGITSDNRDRFRYYIDTPDFEFTGNDLKSGVGGSDLQEAMGSLLSFLGAAAESYAYRKPPITGAKLTQTRLSDDDNSQLFPAHVSEWAYEHSDELSMLSLELEENKDLIAD